MKFAELVSIGHNLATSISDGASFLFGAFELDVHRYAQASQNGRITVDFLTGHIIEGAPPAAFVKVMSEAPAVLAALCRKHGALPTDFKTLHACFGVDRVYGEHFTVLVEDNSGHRSEEVYRGISGGRLTRGHRLVARP